MLTKSELLEPLARARTDEVVVTCMGITRPWGRISNHDLDFASADSAMGHTADLALGIALAQPERRVICLNGDGSMLMSLGTLVTIVEADARNLVLFVLENGTYEITGNQPVPGASDVDFPGLARAAAGSRTGSERESRRAIAFPGFQSGRSTTSCSKAAKSGVRHFEFGGGALFQAPLFYLGRNPFENMRRMRDAVQVSSVGEIALRPAAVFHQGILQVVYEAHAGQAVRAAAGAEGQGGQFLHRAVHLGNLEFLGGLLRRFPVDVGAANDI